MPKKAPRTKGAEHPSRSNPLFADPDSALEFTVQPVGRTAGSLPDLRQPRRAVPQDSPVGGVPEEPPKRQFRSRSARSWKTARSPLDKWLRRCGWLANCKNGISSLRARPGPRHHAEDRLVHASAHPPRDAEAGTFMKLGGGHVEVDETFIGGLARKMHEQQRARPKMQGSSAAGKAPVMAMLERGGKVVAQGRPDPPEDAWSRNPRARATRDDCHTDELGMTARNGSDRDYEHQVIDHAVAYVRTTSTRTASRISGACSNADCAVRTSASSRSTCSATWTSRRSASTSAKTSDKDRFDEVPGPPSGSGSRTPS